MSTQATPSAAATPSAGVRLDSLTGLRFPAALAVFAFHASTHSLDGTVHDVAMAIAGRGYIGVAFFFMLSGFVLTWSRREGDDVRGFYRRRFARIAPVYWVCLAGATLLLLLASGNPIKALVAALPSVVALQAWIPVPAVYFGGNGPGWSISAEAFFYLCFPLLVLALPHRRGRIGLGVLAAVLMLGPALVLHPTGSDQTDPAFWAIYVLPATRISDFIVGMLVAHAVKNGWRPPVGLRGALLLALGAYALTGVTPPWSTVSIVTVVPFALLLAAAATSDLSGRRTVITSPVAMRLGEWSYAFYLVQASVLKVQHEFAQRLGGGPALEWSLVLVAFAVCLALSGALYTIVERPMERRWRHAPRRLTEAT